MEKMLNRVNPLLLLSVGFVITLIGVSLFVTETLVDVSRVIMVAGTLVTFVAGIKLVIRYFNRFS